MPPTLFLDLADLPARVLVVATIAAAARILPALVADVLRGDYR